MNTTPIEGYPTSDTEYSEWSEKYNPPTKVGDPWTQTINAEDLGASGDLKVPDVTTAPDGASGITSATGQSDMLKAMSETLKKQQEAIDKASETQKTWIEKLSGKDKTSQADTLAAQQEKYNISGKLTQIEDITNLTLPLQTQLADLTNRKQREIDRNDARLASSVAKDREANAIDLKYAKMQAPIATQLNAYAAQAQAIQGNLDIANQYISQAVNAATYDQEFEYNQMRDFMSINQNYIDNLTSSQQHLFDQALSIKRDELDYARADKTQVGNLMLEYPSAGISMSDTFDEAVAKAGRVAPATTTTTTGGIKFSSGDIGRISITGLSGQEISQIESDINEFGWNETKKGLEDDQIKAIENVLSGVTPTQAGKPTGKETALADLVSTIDDYKNDWIENGDKGAGTREAFIDKMNTVFPELNKQEIAEQVYKNANDEWLKKNKTFWGNQPGKG